jgi:putative ABC transport system permease protein
LLLNGLGLLLTLVLISLLAILVLMARRRTLVKMAARNIVRKKRYTIIVVAGLLISTAMISGSLVVADTLDYIIKKNTLDTTGLVDEVVWIRGNAGASSYFNKSLAYDLISRVDSGLLEHVDGASPAIREGVTVIKISTGSSAPAGMWFAFDPDHHLNPFLRSDGTPVSDVEVSAGAAVMNQKMADKLEASVGDKLTVIIESGAQVTVNVSAIAENTGMALWRDTEAIFTDLSFAQTVYGRPNQVNSIDVSNKGSADKGYLVTDQAINELNASLPQDYKFSFMSVKKDGIDAAKDTSKQVSQIFIVMSTFAIIAGVALIVNIFVMLAEERKPEMGISRAIGMQRGDLTQSFLFEGVAYALAASAVGAFAGLMIAVVMIALFANMFGGSLLEWRLHFEWLSLATAACAGFLITLLTVAVASWRVSKLNIVRAIRDIPEPILVKSEKRYILPGIAGIVIGAAILASGVTSKQAASLTIGPGLIALGAALVSLRFVAPRLPFTLTAVFFLFWEIDPTNVKERLFGNISSGIEMFIVSGLVLVTGGVLLVMFNSDLLLNGLVAVARKRKTLLPVFKAAISYPMNKKFRTGLSLFIFSLIMFTVVVIAMIASFERESVDTIALKYSGGFEIIGYSNRDISHENLTSGLADLNASLGQGAISRVEAATTAYVVVTKPGSNESLYSSLVGFDDSLLSTGGFSLQKRAGGYRSDAEVWSAVSENSSLVVMDGTVVPQIYGPQYGTFFVSVGDTITAEVQEGTKTELKVIGIMDQIFLQGVFTSSSNVQSLSTGAHTNVFYIATPQDSPVDNKELSKGLENEFVEYGLVTFVVKDTVEQYMSTVSSIMQLMEVFLGVGLVVGIAGLGIITIRNVTERRQEIGVMRAIGYQREMILEVFLLETSFVALLGIVTGVVLGLVLSWRLYDWGGFSENAPFVIPWAEILLLTAMAFLITLGSTLPPSRKASKLAPAEALRKID